MIILGGGPSSPSAFLVEDKTFDVTGLWVRRCVLVSESSREPAPPLEWLWATSDDSDSELCQGRVRCSHPSSLVVLAVWQRRERIYIRVNGQSPASNAALFIGIRGPRHHSRVCLMSWAGNTITLQVLVGVCGGSTNSVSRLLAAHSVVSDYAGSDWSTTPPQGISLEVFQ